MTEQNSSNKRIAKNTIMLYIRMLLMMLVSLYTSRVVLATLGVTDFGIYGVVGGIVSMFSFINGAMATGTQRYLSYELGRGDMEQLKKVFSMSINIHFLLALVVLLLSETIGLWFFYEKMVIPADRFTAAFWVYQFSILAALVMILSVPYNAVIIAHERMSAFAYISIFEAVAKLLIVYLLLLCKWDRLIFYAALILFVQLLVRFIYGSYCKRHFSESRYYFVKEKVLFKEMLGFAGWNFWGNCAGMAFTQGLNLLLNMFFGPVVNAARTVSVQVQAAVTSFTGSFQTALNPQITKSYASGDLAFMHSLIFKSSKFTYLLLFVISLPVFLKADYILNLWLKEVPEYSVIFLRIMLCITVVDAVSNPFMTAAAATGKIKKYQTVVGLTLLSIVPISYIVLKFGAQPYAVFIVHLVVACCAFFIRIWVVRPLVNFSINSYFRSVLVPLIFFTLVAVILPSCYSYYTLNNFINLLVTVLLTVISTALFAYLLVLSKNEKQFLFQKLQLLKGRFIRK